MISRRTGFTLVELMIVIAIIGVLVVTITPQLIAYYARGRDVGRLSDIKTISSRFQDYNRTYGVYPSNTNTVGTTSRCISDIRSWTNASPLIKDKQFAQLGGTGVLLDDAKAANPNIGVCAKPGSYFYTQLSSTTSYGVLAARMERQTTGANYAYPLQLTNPTFINDMVIAGPLDKDGDDLEKLYIIITN